MIIATAGHVDHGKTTLIRALTGVDTDRLPEEKKRGLSIDLGFAYLAHPQRENTTLGFIDVPGHEKFVRNMIAGVGAVDLALLVVAADDGPMPQTREHLAILQLLGVRQLVVVLSKTDLVDSGRMQQVRADIQQLLNASSFAGSAFYAVSAEHSDGTDQLRAHLLDLASQHAQRAVAGYFRLAIDRSFTVTGAGTVVTGTVLSGRVTTDDNLQLLSSGAGVRVRGIRAQDAEASVATGGQRCALNIAGSSLRNAMPKRGDWLTANPLLAATATLDVQLYAADLYTSDDSHNGRRPFKHWTAAHLHLATASTTCRVALLTEDELAPGQRGFARIYCDKPLGAASGDRFVLRDQSARVTIAGGTVVDPQPPGRGRSQQSRLQLLAAMQHNTPSQALAETLIVSASGIDLNGFIARCNCTREELQSLCQQLQVAQCEAGSQWWGVGQAQWQQLQQQLLQYLEQWHTNNPLLPGASLEQLQKQIRPRLSEVVLQSLLQALIEKQSVAKQGAGYRCADWTSTLDEHHESNWQRLLPQLQAAGMIAPRVVEIAELLELPSDDVLKLLNTYVAHERLHRVSANRYYLPETLLALALIAEELANASELTVAGYRDKSGIGRNLVIELLEFFDRVQFTRRSGQQRTILRPANAVFSVEE